MILSLILIAEFIALYLLSNRLIRSLNSLFLLIFRARSVTISLVTLILFPGTVIHELSHLFTAEVLGVRTGKLTLHPTGIESKHFQAGSVEVEKTDPFRRYIIGLAPSIVGIPALTGLSFWAQRLLPEVQASIAAGTLFTAPTTWYLVIAAYLIFVISNTMFSSKQDLKDFFPFAATIVIILGLAWTAGIRVSVTGVALEFLLRGLETLVRTLGIVLALNGVLLLLSRVLIVLVGRITRRVIR